MAFGLGINDDYEDRYDNYVINEEVFVVGILHFCEFVYMIKRF